MRQAGPALLAVALVTACSAAPTADTSSTTTAAPSTTTTTAPVVSCERYREQLVAEWTWLRHTISEARVRLLTAQMAGGQTNVDLLVDLALAAPGTVEDLDEIGEAPASLDRAYDLTSRAAVAVERALLDAASAIGARDGAGIDRAEADLDIAERYVENAEFSARPCP